MNSAEPAFDSNAAKGDNLESIFCCDYAAIRRYVHRFVNDPDDAAEIAQETFLRMLQLRGPENFLLADRVLLFRVARNLAIDHLRRKYTRTRFAEAAPARPAERSREVELLAEEQRAQVRRALQTLRPRDAECLALRNAGHSYDELAVILNIHPGSIGPTVTRALRRLRQAYFAATTGTAPPADRPAAG